jgi:signal peptidase I
MSPDRVRKGGARKGRLRKGRQMRTFLRQNRGFLLFLLLFGLFRTAIADWNPIPSGSMRPTLLEGDLVLVNRLAYDLKVPLTDLALIHLSEPRRGDIVIFHSPRDGTRLIKRIVAVPGDRIEMRAKHLIVNGESAAYQSPTVAAPGEEPGLPVRAERFVESLGSTRHEVQFLFPTSHDNFGPLLVPPDQYLMLGDNRDNSADSRWFGFVSRRLLVGRARYVIGSLDMLGDWLPRPDRFARRLDSGIAPAR